MSLQSDATTLVGTLFAGKYRIESLCGTGGMSAVYKAEHIFMGRTIALKLLLHQTEHALEARRRFEREARIVSQVQHPHAVTIYDFGIEQDIPYLVMEYVEGINLEEILKQRKRLSETAARKIIIQACEALEIAHNLNIVHRDIKPSNIMVHGGRIDDPKIVLLDFGIAKDVGASPDLSPFMTVAGRLVGTPLYMSPEQCTSKPLDGRSDIYALGLVLYELLTGRPPFVCKSALELVMSHATIDPAPLKDASQSAEICLEIERIVMKCLAKEPADRFNSVAELREQLKNIDSHQPPPEVVSPPSSRRSQAAYLTAAVLLLLLFIGTVRRPWASVKEQNQTLSGASTANAELNPVKPEEPVANSAITVPDIIPVANAPQSEQGDLETANVVDTAALISRLELNFQSETEAASQSGNSPSVVSKEEPAAAVGEKQQLAVVLPRIRSTPAVPELPNLSATIRLRHVDNIPVTTRLFTAEISKINVILAVDGISSEELRQGLNFLRLDLVDSAGAASPIGISLLSLSNRGGEHKVKGGLSQLRSARSGQYELVLRYAGREIASQKLEIVP